MNPRRKKIYIAIITICIFGTAGFIYFGFIDTQSPPTGLSIQPTLTPTSGTTKINRGGANQTLPAPEVFPQNSKFNFSALDGVKKFRPFSPLVNDPNLLGRDDPFQGY